MDSRTRTTQYGYDGDGNLTQDGVKTYTYDARDEMTSDGTGSYTYTARGTPSSESSLSGSIAVTFDAYGDQATAGTRSYAYDALGRLAADTATSGRKHHLLCSLFLPVDCRWETVEPSIDGSTRKHDRCGPQSARAVGKVAYCGAFMAVER